MSSILMILSGATQWSQKGGTQRPTGFWSEEFATPHRLLRAADVDVTIATPGGVPAVCDELSLSLQANNGDAAKVAALTAYIGLHADELRTPERLEDIDVSRFDGVIVPGGHGPMQDLAVSESAGRVLTAALADPKKVVAALCHGQASFLAAGDATSWPFKGRRISSFSNTEETQVGLADNAPWLLEDRLRAGGAVIRNGDPWSSHVVIDGNLITGQNPQSAEGVTAAVIKALSQRA